MDYERLPKRLFHRDVARGSRQQGGQVCRYKDTLKRLQTNPAKCEDLARDRKTWRRSVMTGASIYETNPGTAAAAKLETRKSQMRPPPNANAQPTPICSRCQRTFRAPISLTGHPRANCSTQNTSAAVSSSSPASSSTSTINIDSTPGPPLQPPSSSFSSAFFFFFFFFFFSIASTSATVAHVTTTTAYNPDLNLHPVAYRVHHRQPHHCRHLRIQHGHCRIFLPTLSPYIHLTHRPDRSIVNPSHRHWRTSA
nr:unnamed protein product [Spirometra erinaceieuropaei]